MRFFGLIGGAMTTGFIYGHGGGELFSLLPLFVVVGAIFLFFEAAAYHAENEARPRVRPSVSTRTRLHLR